MTIKSRSLGQLVAVCLLSTLPARADEAIKEAYVFSELVGSDGIHCGVAQEALVAYAQAALRQNGIKIDYSASPDIISVYLNVTSVRSGDFCASHVRTTFEIYADGQLPLTKKKYRLASIVLCDRGGIFTGSNYNLLPRIGQEIQLDVDQCVSDINRMAH